MHATRARLPQKRSRSKKPAAKAAAPNLAEVSALQAQSASLHPGITSLALHRAARPRRGVQPLSVEIFGLVEWIAPARESWRRGELEIRRTACMPMTATRHGDGSVLLTDLPGQGDALQLEPEALEALASGTIASLLLTLPGMRLTLTAADLLLALPLMPTPGRILAFTPRRPA